MEIPFAVNVRSNYLRLYAEQNKYASNMAQ